MGEVVDSQPVMLPETVIRLQLVGLIAKFGRLMLAVICFTWRGMPSRIFGISPVVMLTAAVVGLISIFALVTTGAPSSRTNGPAFAGVTIDRPNGAPS